jgi:hypothetical protein
MRNGAAVLVGGTCAKSGSLVVESRRRAVVSECSFSGSERCRQPADGGRTRRGWGRAWCWPDARSPGAVLTRNQEALTIQREDPLDLPNARRATKEDSVVVRRGLFGDFPTGPILEVCALCSVVRAARIERRVFVVGFGHPSRPLPRCPLTAYPGSGRDLSFVGNFVRAGANGSMSRASYGCVCRSFWSCAAATAQRLNGVPFSPATCFLLSVAHAVLAGCPCAALAIAVTH